MTQTKRNIDPVLLHNLLLEWQRDKPLGKQMGNRLGRIIIAIVGIVMAQGKFRSYTDSWRLEMNSRAQMILISGCHNYNPEKSTDPFNYLALSAHRAILQQLAHEKENPEIASFDAAIAQNENALNELRDNQLNIERDKYQKDLNSLFEKFISSDPTMENRFLVKLQQDWIGLKEKECVVKYKIPKKKILECLELLQYRLREFYEFTNMIKGLQHQGELQDLIP